MNTGEPVVRLTTGESGKPLVRVFCSFAGDDKRHAQRLWRSLTAALAIDGKYEFRPWQSDKAILLGEKWDTRIREALSAAELGVLAVSPAFLGSGYITDVELPALVNAPGKRVVPVLLRRVNKQADWRGLKDKQVHGYAQPFAELRDDAARDKWVDTLVTGVHRVLSRYGTRFDESPVT